MKIRFIRCVAAGLAGMAGMMAVSYFAPRYGLYGLDVPRTLGGIVFRDAQPALWFGAALHLLFGALFFPVLYAALAVRLLPGPGALRGWLWAVVLWGLWAYFGMQLLAAYHPQITGGMMQDPGTLLLNLGPTAPAESLLAHSVYGLLFGWICGRPSRSR